MRFDALIRPWRRAVALTLSTTITLLALPGCGGMRPTTFLHPEYNFAYVERVAVIPLENLTSDQSGGARATRYFVNELLATEAFDVVEPGEVARVLSERGLRSTAALPRDVAVEIGKQLAVQGLFLGSIADAETARGRSVSENTVTISVRLVETETGATVWSTTHTEGGRGFWSKLFGTNEHSLSEVTRRCVQKTIATLVN